MLAVGATGYLTLLATGHPLVTGIDGATQLASTPPAELDLVERKLARVEQNVSANTAAVARAREDISDLQAADTDLAQRLVSVEAWAATTTERVIATNSTPAPTASNTPAPALTSARAALADITAAKAKLIGTN